MSRKAIRKQHVSLRFKRREQLKHQLRVFGVRGVALALIVGFGGGLVAGRDSYASLFIQHHAPLVDLNMPQVLAGLPIQAGLPKNTFWLWCPGSGLWLQRQICQRYPSVRAVRLERHFDMNRLMVHVEPRIPLVTWNGFGFDKEGVLFPVVPRAWNALPQAALPASVNKHDLSLWLVRLASVTDLWPQVTSVREDLSETMALTLKTGTVVIWGTLETEPTLYKAQALLRVLDDAHQNLGGASRADLRFFEQGRIIVLPKGK